MNEKTALPYHVYIMSSTVVIGVILTVLEIVVQIYIIVSSTSDTYRFSFYFFFSLVPFFTFYFILLFTYIKWRKIGFVYVTFHVHGLFFLLLIYHYALPTFF